MVEENVHCWKKFRWVCCPRPSCSGGKKTTKCTGCGAACPKPGEKPPAKPRRKPDWWHMEIVIHGEGKYYETMAADARALKREHPSNVRVSIRGKH